MTAPLHDQGPARGPSWHRNVKRIAALLVTGVAFYVLLPTLARVFSAWPQLSSLQLAWLVPAAVSEAGSFTCTFGLKRIALHTKAWFAIVTAGLVGNAVTNVFPGADATGAATELRLLSTAGIDTATAVGGLTATGYLQTGSLLVLPVLAVPAILIGVPISRGLVHIVYLGLGVFVVYVLGGYLVFVRDRPLVLAGHVIEAIHNRLLRRRAPLTEVAGRLLRQRDATRSALGQHWRGALLCSIGRVGLDFFCLLAAMAATRASAQPAVVLIAYSATTVLALLPFTPGGLGIVEGSLTGLLTLAGLPAALAALTVLTYRLFSYWLPTASGPIAYFAFRRRFHGPPTEREISNVSRERKDSKEEPPSAGASPERS